MWGSRSHRQHRRGPAPSWCKTGQPEGLSVLLRQAGGRALPNGTDSEGPTAGIAPAAAQHPPLPPQDAVGVTGLRRRSKGHRVDLCHAFSPRFWAARDPMKQRRESDLAREQSVLRDPLRRCSTAAGAGLGRAPGSHNPPVPRHGCPTRDLRVQAHTPHHPRSISAFPSGRLCESVAVRSAGGKVWP